MNFNPKSEAKGGNLRGDMALVTLHDERAGVNYAGAGRYCPTTLPMRMNPHEIDLNSIDIGAVRAAEKSVAYSLVYCGGDGIFHGDGAIERDRARASR